MPDPQDPAAHIIKITLPKADKGFITLAARMHGQQTTGSPLSINAFALLAITEAARNVPGALHAYEEARRRRTDTP